MNKKSKYIFVGIILILIIGSILITLFSLKNKNHKIRGGAITEIYDELPSQYNIDKIPKDSLSYKILEKTYIEIQNEEYFSDGTGEIELIASSPDLVKLMNQGMEILDKLEGLKFYEQQEKIEENMCNILNSNNYPKQEKSIKVKVQNKNNHWEIVHSDEFANAISGNISFLLMDSVNNLIGE